jgi:alkylation response protein AidB-like acyl-CoA dehydrogenase
MDRSGITVAAHNSLGTNHIFLAGNEAQKKKVRSAARERRMARGLGAHRARLRLRRQRARTTAVKKGDRYVLNGNKTFITNGRYADVASSSR